MVAFLPKYWLCINVSGIVINAYGDQKLVVTMADRDRRPSVKNEDQNPPITKNKRDDQNTPITMNHSGTLKQFKAWV